ncbi:unnamed protein product, partial [Ectocarpus fasciculatus]
VHGGGIDSENKITPTHLYSAPASLFLRSFAAEAAGHIVESDFAAASSERLLLTGVEIDTVDEDTLRVQLAALHQRIHGQLVEADSETVDETLALYFALRAETDPVAAWKILLLAMFQDIRVAYY